MRTYWMIALAIFMLLYAAFTITNLAVDNGKFVLGAVAAITGILIFFERRSPGA